MTHVVGKLGLGLAHVWRFPWALHIPYPRLMQYTELWIFTIHRFSLCLIILLPQHSTIDAAWIVPQSTRPNSDSKQALSLIPFDIQNNFPPIYNRVHEHDSEP